MRATRASAAWLAKPTAFAIIWIPAFAGMTGWKTGNDGAKTGGDGAKTVHLSLMSAPPSRRAKTAVSLRATDALSLEGRTA